MTFWWRMTFCITSHYITNISATSENDHLWWWWWSVRLTDWLTIWGGEGKVMAENETTANNECSSCSNRYWKWDSSSNRNGKRTSLSVMMISPSHLSDHDNVAAVNYAVAAVTRTGKKEVSSLRSCFIVQVISLFALPPTALLPSTS